MNTLKLNSARVYNNRRKLLFKCAFTVAFFQLLFFSVDYGQQISRVSPAGTKFLFYTPPGYNPATTSYPLLVCLHGGSSIGDDLTLLTSNLSAPRMPAKLIWQGNWPANRPFIIVSPQLKRDLSFQNFNDQEWPAGLVDEVVEYVRSTENVDPNRMYFTGISLGGAACWDYAATYPSKVAAVVAFSSKTNIANACNVKDIPIWAFHGENDGLVNPIFAIDMVNAVNACVPTGLFNPHLNLLHANAHAGWDEVYDGSDGYNVFDWMLQFVKNTTINKAPYVNAGIDQKILLRGDAVDLPSEFFDSDGTIASAVWTQTNGPAVTLDQTNNKLLKISNLVAGTLEFQLLVTDNLGASNSDKVMLQVFNTTPADEAAITDFVLVNNTGPTDIGSITEDMVINTTTLTTNTFNIKAIPNANTGSVRFRISSDQNTFRGNTPGGASLSMQNWQIPDGDYTFCVTAYKSKISQGQNTPGLSQIFKVRVTTNNYYSKAGTDISSLTSWGNNADGSGTAPSSFSANYQVFNILNTVTLDNALTISGQSSILWVKDGGQLTINNSVGNLVNAGSNSIVNINTSQPVTLGTLSPSSSVNIGGSATSIPHPFQYGNLLLTGSGTKSLSSATVTRVSGNVTIGSGVTLSLGTKPLSITGNFTNMGIFSPGTSTVTLNGTGAQTITGANAFNNLVISKSTGNVTLSGTGSTTMNNVLTLTSGHVISSNTNKLIFASGASISGGSLKSFMDGPVSKTLDINATFTFPLGNVLTNRFRPTTLAHTTASDTWTLRYMAHDPSTDGYSRLLFNPIKLSSVSQFEYWDISRIGTTAADLTISYNTGSYNSSGNIGTVSKLRIAHWDGTKWDLPLGSGTTSSVGSNTNGTVTVTNVTSFSPQTIGVMDGALPVAWSSFTANHQTGAIILFWQTAMEHNNDHFEVERSIDGFNFNSIGIKKAVGNSKISQRYQFEDTEISDYLTYYYRIRQVDLDGKFDVSDIIAVNAIGKSGNQWAVWPNPITGQQHLHLEMLDKSKDGDHVIKAQILSPNGSVIFKDEASINNLRTKLESFISNLNNGIYIIVLSDELRSEYFRIAHY